MRNTYTAAARAAHAPGDDKLARALKEALNSRALRACPSGHKCIPLARAAGEAIPADVCPGDAILRAPTACSSAFVGWNGFTSKV